MSDDITIKVRLQGARQVSQESKRMAGGIGDMGDAADRTKRDAREMGSALTKAGAAGKRGGGLLAGGLGKALALTGGIYTLGRGIGFAAREYTEAARVGAQTGNVIKSTGGAAKVTRNEVETLAGALSLKTGIDDEAIQSGSNLLLTFKNIRNEAGKGNRMFDRATAGALDLSAAGFGSVESASKMLGKALNDPVKGLATLGKAGVTFTEQQKTQITGLAESGDMLGAQSLIMRELESQVKGSAAAQAQPIDKMRVGFGNLAESMAGIFAPEVNRRIEQGSQVLDKLNASLSPILGQENLSLGEKWDLAVPLVKQDMKPFVDEIGKTLQGAEVGENLSKAFEKGAPVLVDAVAASAPHAAGAFVSAFKEAGPWGKLLTVGFVASKLGAFRAAGGLGAEMFTNRFGKRLTLKSAFRSAAIEGAATSSASAAGTMAGGVGVAGSLATSLESKRGRFKAIGKGVGRMIGPGIVAGIILSFGPDMVKLVDEKLHDLFGKKGGDPSPTGTRDQRTRYYEGKPFPTFPNGVDVPNVPKDPDPRKRYPQLKRPGRLRTNSYEPMAGGSAVLPIFRPGPDGRGTVWSGDTGLRGVVKELAAATNRLASAERDVHMDGALIGKQIARRVARDQVSR